MEPPPAAGGPGAPGPGPGGSPAPFLIKTYDMVDDAATDDIVSWSATATSFVVWNPPDFAARLLPTYFKHNNFSSFIRQLNTYGFRKIDPERWEFANEEFIKDQKHLLKNIHRRKPIHSHSIPPGSSGGLSDAERAAFDDEIDRLSREKTALQTELWRFKQQQSGTRIQLDDLERRMLDMEQRQLRMVAFLQRAMDNPKFVDCLVRMAGAGVEEFAAAAVQRKRRLQVELDYYPENGLFDSGRPEIGQVFSDKLRLELCPAMSGNNLVSPSTQSSNEDARSPSTGPGLAILPESLELSDTGASKNSPYPQIPDDGLLACHLSLTLASCPMQVDRSHATNLLDSGEATEVRAVDTCIEHDHVVERNIGASSGTGNVPSSGTGNVPSSGTGNVQSLPESAKAGSQAPTAPPGRVNDVFWEQFLTERPGSSDAEEASSILRAYPVEEQPEDRNRGSGNAWRNRKDLEQLTL